MIAAPRHRAARALILGAGGIGAILRGIAYLPAADPPRTSQLSPIEAWMPLTAWAALWMAVGIALIISTWCRTVSIWAMTALTALLTLWSTSYLIAWLWMGVGRSWVTASIFLMAAIWAGVLTSLLERRH